MCGLTSGYKAIRGPGSSYPHLAKGKCSLHFTGETEAWRPGLLRGIGLLSCLTPRLKGIRHVPQWSLPKCQGNLGQAPPAGLCCLIHRQDSESGRTGKLDHSCRFCPPPPQAGLNAVPMRACEHPALRPLVQHVGLPGGLLLVPLAPKYCSLCTVPLVGVLCQAAASWFLKLRRYTLPCRVSVATSLSLEYTGLQDALSHLVQPPIGGSPL